MGFAREDYPSLLLVCGTTNERVALIERPIVDTGIDLLRLIKRAKRETFEISRRESVGRRDRGTGFAEEFRGRWDGKSHIDGLLRVSEVNAGKYNDFSIVYILTMLTTVR